MYIVRLPRHTIAKKRYTVVYNDGSRRPDPSAFSKIELWHSDVSYEVQPPGTTSLKILSGPEVGGDTLWASGYALYSNLSPFFQKYLESLSAVHSAVAQADGARAAGLPVRREPIESVGHFMSFCGMLAQVASS